MEKLFGIGNLYFDIISIIVVVLILFNAIKGIRKGLLYSILKLIKMFIVLIGASLLARPLANYLINSGIGTSWIQKIGTNIEGLGGIFANPLSGSDKLNVVVDALESLNIPKSIIEILSNYISKFTDVGDTSLGLLIARGIVYYILVGICFFAIMLIINIIFIFILKLAKRVNDSIVLGGINKLLGAVFCMVVCYIVLDIAIYLISVLMMWNTSMMDFFSSIMNLNSDKIFTISKFMYNHNITKHIIGALI